MNEATEAKAPLDYLSIIVVYGAIMGGVLVTGAILMFVVMPFLVSGCPDCDQFARTVGEACYYAGQLNATGNESGLTDTNAFKLKHYCLGD